MRKILLSLITLSILFSCEGPQGDGGSPGEKGDQGDPGNTLRFYLQRGGGSLTYSGYSDAYISATSPASNFNTEDSLVWSQDNRLLIRFDNMLSPIRTASGVDANDFTVNEAILYLYTELDAPAEISAYTMSTETAYNFSTLSWNKPSDNAEWETIGAAGAIADTLLIGYKRTPGALADIVALYLNPDVVEEWIDNNSDNNGMLLTLNGAEGFVLSGDYVDLENLLYLRPMLFLDLQRTNTRMAAPQTSYPDWKLNDEAHAFEVWENAPFNR